MNEIEKAFYQFVFHFSEAIQTVRAHVDHFVRELIEFFKKIENMRAHAQFGMSPVDPETAAHLAQHLDQQLGKIYASQHKSDTLRNNREHPQGPKV